MHKKIRPFLLITIGMVVAFASSALAPSSLGLIQANPTSTPVLATVTVTATQFEKPELVPGDTNLILLLGTVLVVIILTAVIWHRRDWER